MTTHPTTALGGTFTFPGTDLRVNRLGYGAMQLAGPHVFGPPKDRAACVAVLREARALGVNHIDTSDFYGPHVVNQIIREALHPYADELVLVTKIGFRRDAQGAWLPAASPAELRSAVEDNLRHLGLDAIPIVNVRSSDEQRDAGTSLAPLLDVVAELKQRGLVRHIGLSNVNAAQIADARRTTDIVCVQNLYNLAHRTDDALVDALARDGIAYVPFFPLGGFTPLQSQALADAATALDATPMQVALAWLLQRSPNLLLIPGTSSVAHLRENLKAATLRIPADTLASLDAIASSAKG